MSAGMVRVASFPIWWQLRQTVTMLPSHCCECSPGGSSTIDSHHAAG